MGFAFAIHNCVKLNRISQRPHVSVVPKRIKHKRCVCRAETDEITLKPDVFTQANERFHTSCKNGTGSRPTNYFKLQTKHPFPFHTTKETSTSSCSFHPNRTIFLTGFSFTKRDHQSGTRKAKHCGTRPCQWRKTKQQRKLHPLSRTSELNKL